MEGGTSTASPNFSFLPKREQLLVQLATLAEHYFATDPNTCLLKLRQFGEVWAQRAAAYTGIFTGAEELQTDLLRRLRDQGVLTVQVADIFHGLRKTGNEANCYRAILHNCAARSFKENAVR